jgi:mono/diheme cytochrome c family protein
MLRSTVKMLALLASLSFVVACGGDDGDSGPDCTDTMAQMRGATVISTTCQSCHAGTVTGTDRGGAPDAITFDDAADIDAQEARIRARAIDKSPTPMPPAPGSLSAAQIADLEAYLDCR